MFFQRRLLLLIVVNKLQILDINMYHCDYIIIPYALYYIHYTLLPNLLLQPAKQTKEVRMEGE